MISWAPRSASSFNGSIFIIARFPVGRRSRRRPVSPTTWKAATPVGAYTCDALAGPVEFRASPMRTRIRKGHPSPEKTAVDRRIGLRLSTPPTQSRLDPRDRGIYSLCATFASYGSRAAPSSPGGRGSNSVAPDFRKSATRIPSHARTGRSRETGCGNKRRLRRPIARVSVISDVGEIGVAYGPVALLSGVYTWSPSPESSGSSSSRGVGPPIIQRRGARAQRAPGWRLFLALYGDAPIRGIPAAGGPVNRRRLP